MKLKPVFLILFINFIFMFSYSQEYDPYTYQTIEAKPTLDENIFFGGGFGLQLGSLTSIKITPEIGYRIHPNFEPGIGAYYLYVKNYNYNFTDQVFGAKIFARFFIYNDVFIQGEYELLSISDYDPRTYLYTGDRAFIPGLLGGIGYRQKIGNRAAVLSSIFYNFQLTEKTPYHNPVIRFTLIF